MVAMLPVDSIGTAAGSRTVVCNDATVPASTGEDINV